MTIIDNHDITYFYDDDEANIELASSLDCKAELVWFISKNKPNCYWQNDKLMV